MLRSSGGHLSPIGCDHAYRPPSGAFFSHDKLEGVATADGGRTLYVANDSDFGMDHLLGLDEAACEASGLVTIRY